MFTTPFVVWVTVFRTDHLFASPLEPSWVGFTDEEVDILKGNRRDNLFALLSS